MNNSVNTLLQLTSINNSNGTVLTGALLTKQKLLQKLPTAIDDANVFIVCFFVYFITL